MALDVTTYVLAKNASKKYTDEKIAAISSGMTYKGSVSTYNNLPITGNKKGDVYTVSDTHKEFVWSIEATSGALTDWNEIGGAGYTVTVM